MKWSPTRPAVVRGHMARLGIGAVRVTLRWSPGETSPRGSTMVALRRAQDTARGRRLVLAVYSKARKAPQIARRRQEYCSYVASLLALAPRVNDVVIWNEPNSNRFWQPQFAPDGSSASAPAYELLLAECWDVLHAVRPGVNVIAASAPRGNDDPAADHPSQSPVAFYTALGAAYRASSRDRPIFDTVGHNPYPNTSAEPPWVRHEGGTIGEGDYSKLVSVLRTGFGGTAQPVPGTGLTVAANFQYFSGKPWTASASVALSQNPNQRILIEPRGSRRLSSQSLLDLRISRPITIAPGRRIELLFDILNALNDAAEESIVTDTLVTESIKANPSFGQPNAFVDPRRVLLGIRVNLGKS